MCTFLFSNFDPARVEYRGIVYPTVEHFYQAMKTLDLAERRRIAELPRAADAKRASKTLNIRPDWEEQKDRVMWHGLRQKFAPGTVWAAKLKATGDEPIVEDNFWHDQYWGKCHCPRCGGKGRNRLGEMLMYLRDNVL